MTEDLYGLRLDDLELARDLVERRLGVKMLSHSSSFYGGDYYQFQAPTFSGLAQKNYDEEQVEYAEEEFSAYGVLVLVTAADCEEADRCNAGLVELPGATHIRRL